MKIIVQEIANGKQGLFIDGLRVGTSDSVYLSSNSVSIYHTRISEKLLNGSPNDFPEYFKTISIRYPIDSSLISKFVFHRLGTGWDVWIDFDLDGENWKNRWSIKEFCECVIELAVVHEREVKYDSEFYTNDFELEILTTQTGSFRDLIEAATKAWRDFYSEVEANLDHAVIVEFEFPPEIKVACEQYLQYFGQFLKDLGVDSDTSVSHNGKLTILSSTPADKLDALGKIRHALDIYLKLSAIESAPRSDEPIVAHQLAANILHLQSQLSLANALIEAKNATIAAQASTLLNAQLLATTIFVPKHSRDNKTEPILGGIVTLGATESKYGLSVSWAELFRRLRGYFKRE